MLNWANLHKNCKKLAENKKENYYLLERFGTLLFWRTVERNWNGTSSNSKVDGTERNKFQFIAGWNGTERVPKKSERSTTLHNIFHCKYILTITLA